jgi:hypothetical protein
MEISNTGLGINSRIRTRLWKVVKACSCCRSRGGEAANIQSSRGRPTSSSMTVPVVMVDDNLVHKHLVPFPKCISDSVSYLLVLHNCAPEVSHRHLRHRARTLYALISVPINPPILHSTARRNECTPRRSEGDTCSRMFLGRRTHVSKGIWRPRPYRRKSGIHWWRYRQPELQSSMQW